MIVISNPTPYKNEIKLIHSLFTEGLLLFHIRKPLFSEDEMKTYLFEIGSEYNNRLILHQHHQLAEDFGINRLHFTEKMRTKTFPESLKKRKERGFKLSTSIHNMPDFEKLHNAFDYAFLGPVFDSISKPNYASNLDFRMELSQRKNYKTALVGVGGITPSKIKTALDFGFDDVALLGTIWHSINPVENFKLCQKTDRSY